MDSGTICSRDSSMRMGSPAVWGVAAARTNSHRGVMTAVPKELSLGLQMDALWDLHSPEWSPERPSCKPQRQFFRTASSHPMAVCPRRRTPKRQATPSSSMSPSSRSSRNPFTPATSWESVFTPERIARLSSGRIARSRGAWVVYGGIHATLFPEEAFERGKAHAVVTGDGDLAWAKSSTIVSPQARRVYAGGRLEGSEFCRPLGPDGSAEVYVGLGTNHSRLSQALSFCSVWAPTDRSPGNAIISAWSTKSSNSPHRFRFIALAMTTFIPSR